MTDPVYDAFVSYSHAADDLLAPRLQAGLQRFAKPWWRRRALRIFRDESSLSASPHLWASIVTAMEGSAWFVLLLSPDAASSPWVNQEINWWAQNKDPSRIIPVLTDGTFIWTNGEVGGDVAPQALRGVFSEEPRWVDLRFARDEEQLDLKNPRFSAAVADIASALRGIPKDELESEEVRQHRRTIRTAWAAGAVVVLLALLATGAAFFAFDQLALARSRELAASAINVLDRDPELSVLLALEAAKGTEPPFESVSALHQALQSQRTVRTIVWPEEGTEGVPVLGPISPDGRYAALTQMRHQLFVWDLEAGSDQPLWSFEVAWPDHVSAFPYFTRDGSRVVVTVAWFSNAEWAPPDPSQWPEPFPEVGVYVLDVTNGAVLEHFRGPRCPVSSFITGASPFIDTTSRVAVAVPAGEDCSPFEVGVWFMDLTTGEMELAFEGPLRWWAPEAPAASVTADGRLLAFSGERETTTSEGATTTRVVDLETGEEILAVAGGGWPLLSGDGSLLSASGTLWDLDTGNQLWDNPIVNLGTLRFSEDQRFIYAGGQDGVNRVWSTETGQLVYELRGHRGWTNHVSMTADGTRLASPSGDGTMRIWDLTAQGVGEVGGLDLGGQVVLRAGNVGGGKATTLVYPGELYAEPGEAVVFDALSGRVLQRLPDYGGQMVRLSPDGTLLVGQQFVAPGWLGAVHIRDLESGEVLVELEGVCAYWEYSTRTGPECQEAPEGPFVVWDPFIEFSPDGSMLAVSHAGDRVGVWDVRSGRRLWLSEPEAGDIVGFSPQSDLLAYEERPDVRVVKTESWTEVTSLPTAVFQYDLIFGPDGGRLLASNAQEGLLMWDASTWVRIPDPAVGQYGIIRDLDVNADGSLIAHSETDSVRVRDFQSGRLLQTIPIGAPVSIVGFLDDRHLLIVPEEGHARVMTTNVPELLEIARSRVTRGFTAGECDTYHIDPCPTLEDIRQG